jgi:predicted RNA methylase
MGAAEVYATDLDEFALELVKASAEEQGLSDRIRTSIFDLETGANNFPLADLYILSDVFESSRVAIGAARVSQCALQLGAHVWVFAQSDRTQREAYRREMQKGLGESFQLAWSSQLDGPSPSKLWLCDIDETTVNYG